MHLKLVSDEMYLAALSLCGFRTQILNQTFLSDIQVEKELIDKLDMLVNDNKGDNEYKELFSTM